MCMHGLTQPAILLEHAAWGAIHCAEDKFCPAPEAGHMVHRIWLVAEPT